MEPQNHLPYKCSRRVHNTADKWTGYADEQKLGL